MKIFICRSTDQRKNGACILLLFLFHCFVAIALAQNSSLEVYDAEGNEIGTLKLLEAQESQYILLEDISKLFGGTRKNEPLFGRMTLILNDKRIVVIDERNRIKVNDEEVTISKPALTISRKLAVPMDFLTRIISKTINKRMVLDLNTGTLEITNDPYGSRGNYKKAIYRVMIDPGHGGYDVGAKSKSGLLEKNLALELAQKIKNILSSKEDMEVFLIRSEDKYMTLDERVKLANNLRGNVLLSIHFNASPSDSSKGFCVCVNNERMTTGTGMEPSSTASMYYAQSRRLGNEIRARLAKIITSGGKDREAPLGIMSGLFMPSVLVEVLYLSNQNDVDTVTKANFMDSVAMALSDSILSFSLASIQESTEE